jgi:hypothetical protein
MTSNKPIQLADDNKEKTAPNSGHWIAEEQPVLLVKLLNNIFGGNSTTSTR